MTKKETMAYKRAAKEACTVYGIKVYMSNMILLESGIRDGIIDYVLFRDKSTGAEYSCAYGPNCYNMERGTLWDVQCISKETNGDTTEEQPPAARYMEQVEQADSLERLWSIYKAATNDDTVSAVQCNGIYQAAAHQAKRLDERRG